MRNVFTIDADIKLKMLINEPTVVQNDNIRFIINVFDGGQPLSLDSATTVSLSSTRLDRVTVVTPGTKTGTNTVQFDLGTEETKVPGRVEATAQFYDSEGRVSTISFSYRVVKDPTGDGYVPSEREQTLIETVLNDGPLVIQQAQDAANFANKQGQFAQTQANAASEAAQNANDAARSATNAANEANAAAASANNAAASANAAADNANTKATNAQTQADYAKSQGDYAKTQGDYAKAQGDYAKTQGDYAKQVGDENKTRWLTAVNTYADIATTYPNPQLGDTVQTIDDSKIYRWNGTQWVWTQQYNANAITDVQNKIGILFELARWVDGIDDTTSVQNAINKASTSSHYVKLEPNKTYVVRSLVPKENVIIDLNGSTLKLKDNTQLPVFYDWATPKTPKYKNFGVINGTIDANMQNNNSVNQSAGVFWLTDWDGLTFKNLKITNAFRNIINLYGCYNIDIDNINCENNGMNANGFYSYGATFEPGCKNIRINKFTVKNMYGFGIHFNQAEDFTAENLTFDTLNHPSSTAITLTQSKRGKVNNINCKNVSGDNIEINACKELEISNINIDSAGNRPLLFGDNSTDLYSERVKISNLVTTNTLGSYGVSVNYLKNSEFRNCAFDKRLTTLANTITDNVRFFDCSFNVNMPVLAIYYNKFKFINTKFNDILVQRLENTIGEFGNVGVSVSVPSGGVLNIPIANLEKSGSGATGGRLCVMSSFTGNFAQSTYQEYAFLFYGGTLNATQLVSLDGSYQRKITITTDPTNKQFVLTNSTGVDLLVKWNIICQ